MAHLTTPYDNTTQYFVAFVNPKDMQKFCQAILEGEFGSTSEPDKQNIRYKGSDEFQALRFKNREDIIKAFTTVQSEGIEASFYSRPGDDGDIQKWSLRTESSTMNNKVKKELISRRKSPFLRFPAE